MQPLVIDVQKSAPWWRYGHVWLVLAGPILVVIACFVTAFIAMRHPDPVLAQDYYRRGLHINKTLAEQKAITAQNALQMAPAMQTRNHVATPKTVVGGDRP